jgi:hypothetical protein
MKALQQTEALRTLRLRVRAWENLKTHETRESDEAFAAILT